MRAVTFLVVLALVACKQGDPEKCETAVRNYATLMYWKNADRAIAAAPPEKRDELRKEKLADFTAKMEKGVQTLVTQCVSANDKEAINCMIAAKTAEEVQKCASPAETN